MGKRLLNDETVRMLEDALVQLGGAELECVRLICLKTRDRFIAAGMRYPAVAMNAFALVAKFQRDQVVVELARLEAQLDGVAADVEIHHGGNGEIHNP